MFVFFFVKKICTPVFLRQIWLVLLLLQIFALLLQIFALLFVIDCIEIDQWQSRYLSLYIINVGYIAHFQCNKCTFSCWVIRYLFHNKHSISAPSKEIHYVILDCVISWLIMVYDVSFVFLVSGWIYCSWQNWEYLYQKSLCSSSVCSWL